MKIFNRLAVILAIVSVCLIPAQVSCRVRTVASEHELQQLVGKAPVLVALFYKNDKEAKGALQNYRKVSSVQRYDDAGVVFVAIDVDQRGSVELMKRYNVGTTPTVILFDWSVMAPNGIIGRLIGFETSQKLQEFIESNCGGKINNLVVAKQRTENRKERRDVLDKDPYFDSGAEIYPDFPRPYARGPYNPR